MYTTTPRTPMNSNTFWLGLVLIVVGSAMWERYDDNCTARKVAARCVDACAAHGTWGVYKAEGGTCACVELVTPEPEDLTEPPL